MAKSYSDIINDAEMLVQDAGLDPSTPGANSVFATAELDAFVPFALTRLSQFRPWEIKTTKSTVADSRDITLTTGDKWRYLGIEKLEYEVDKDPRRFRNFTRFASVLSIKIDTAPSSAADIYFFWNKNHILLSATGASTTSGAIKTAAAVGAVSLDLDSLGTGTIDEMSSFTIAGDTTVYYVLADATITTNEATVSIWPPLVVAVTGAEVVTLVVTDTIEEIPLEGYLARLLAATACISKATKSYSQVNAAITTIANAVTAIAAVAARITQGVADAASGRTAADLVAAAVILSNLEFDKMATEVDLAKTALASGNSLINTIPVGGGAAEYMGQAASDVGVSQGYLATGQSYLQEASANNSNATQYFNAAAAELRAASEKADEAIVNLRLVATRLQVSQGGLRYEEWGRRELLLVETELRAYAGYPISKRYQID